MRYSKSDVVVWGLLWHSHCSSIRYSLGWLHLISTCNKLPPRSDQSTKADIGNNYALATLIIIFSFYKLLFQAYILIILRVCVCVCVCLAVW